jgi:hypothetical protein
MFPWHVPRTLLKQLVSCVLINYTTALLASSKQQTLNYFIRISSIFVSHVLSPRTLLMVDLIF